jgi:hypothetical protein
MKRTLVLLVAFLLSANALAAERLLGAAVLTGIPDRDIINVPGICPSPAHPMIRSLKVTVRKHAAQIDQLDVRYGNGIWEPLDVRQHFAPETSSRWIDLRGDNRCVDAIKIVGRADGMNHDRDTLVEVWGRD